mmetsp:Transcript_15985/g.32632  ORF Transcript_15985/g.32632 Transcript_15985/m.32632 type:complete len:278 (+) Transcript_15985:1245-2078(+)
MVSLCFLTVAMNPAISFCRFLVLFSLTFVKSKMSDAAFSLPPILRVRISFSRFFSSIFFADVSPTLRADFISTETRRSTSILSSSLSFSYPSLSVSSSAIFSAVAFLAALTFALSLTILLSSSFFSSRLDFLEAFSASIVSFRWIWTSRSSVSFWVMRKSWSYSRRYFSICSLLSLSFFSVSMMSTFSALSSFSLTTKAPLFDFTSSWSLCSDLSRSDFLPFCAAASACFFSISASRSSICSKSPLLDSERREAASSTLATSERVAFRTDRTLSRLR